MNGTRNAADEGVWDRTVTFWSGFFTGSEIIESPPAAFEEVPGRYDIGDIVTTYTRGWLGVAPNHATPIELMDLLEFLDEFTKKLEAEDKARRMPVVGPGVIADCDTMDFFQEGYASICRDLERWRLRLDEYLAHTDAVPIDKENDRRETLWEVTAPLFLGWYGGRTGAEIDLDAKAFPPAFNPELQHPADIATPYAIANRMDIYYEWADERVQRLKTEVIEPFKVSAPRILGFIVIAGLLYVGTGLLIAGKYGK